MKLKDLVKNLDMRTLAAGENIEGEVKGGYVSDLLSDVMANSKEGDIWITQQIHQNVIAVASLKELSGVVIVGNRKPDDDTIQKAEEQKVSLFSSGLPAFEIVGKLFSLGISGLR